MKNKLMAVILVIALAFSLSVPAFAAGFSDLEGNWSKTYMQDLADRGYFAGYSDGTIRPNNHITVCETLVLLSRFYSPDDEGLAQMHTDYDTYISNTVSASLSWAYDGIMICLASGIVTKTELAAMDLTAEIQKEQLAVFLVRAMQLQADAELLSSVS
jgi:hypothetical protein